jgi:hypothetical protein
MAAENSTILVETSFIRMGHKIMPHISFRVRDFTPSAALLGAGGDSLKPSIMKLENGAYETEG